MLIVTQSRPEAVAAMSLSLPTLCDPERAAYRYFGLDRGRWSMFFRSGVLLRYLRLIFTGWRPHRGEAEEDMLQLGCNSAETLFSLPIGVSCTPTGAMTRPTDRPRVSSSIRSNNLPARTRIGRYPLPR
jgi:hypothetical protein